MRKAAVYFVGIGTIIVLIALATKDNGSIKPSSSSVSSGGPVADAVEYRLSIAKAHTEEQAKRPGVHIGMTKEEARTSSWGYPDHTNTTITADATREQWVYEGDERNNYLYFTNNVLTGIQN